MRKLQHFGDTQQGILVPNSFQSCSQSPTYDDYIISTPPVLKHPHQHKNSSVSSKGQCLLSASTNKSGQIGKLIDIVQQQSQKKLRGKKKKLLRSSLRRQNAKEKENTIINVETHFPKKKEVKKERKNKPTQTVTEIEEIEKENLSKQKPQQDTSFRTTSFSNLFKNNVFVFSDSEDQENIPPKLAPQSPSKYTFNPRRNHFLKRRSMNNVKPTIQEQGIRFNELKLGESDSYILQPIKKCRVYNSLLRRHTQDESYMLYDSVTYRKLAKVVKQGSCYDIYHYPFCEEEELIAKITSNLVGSYYHLCHTGPYHQHNFSLLTIQYQTNLFGINGPRKMYVYAPRQLVFTEGEDLQKYYEEKKNSQIQKLKNTQADWSPEHGCYVVDLKSKAKLPSVKNFRIVSTDKEPHTATIFGKASKNTFNLAVYHPFNLLQGIALAMSSFGRKIFSE